MSHTLIFDIGKTNKKCFVFDEQYEEIYKEYTRIEEIADEDGDPCDDLKAIEAWVKATFQKIISNEKFEINAVNFSTYGASFVHLDKSGRPLTPLYNYLKPYPETLLNDFYSKYGMKEVVAKETASPSLAMLNSGLQLYYLKYAKPDIYNQIQYSIHFPQYLSSLFSNVYISDFTSIGCHTMLWDYEEHDYHHWVYAEELDKILPPIATKNQYVSQTVSGREIKIGVGIHDSSAALIPYLKSQKKPFLLISTGTWSISLNPFSNASLSNEDLKNDSLNFLQTSGKTVRASRLFLGNEYKIQVKVLRNHYKKEEGYHKLMKFDQQLYLDLKDREKNSFRFDSISISRKEPEITDLSSFNSYEEAYHKLMIELVNLQIDSSQRAIGDTKIEKLFIDGGFADNDLFVNLLAIGFKDIKIRTTVTPLGSALGAAMVLSKKEIKKKFLKKHYSMKKPDLWK